MFSRNTTYNDLKQKQRKRSVKNSSAAAERDIPRLQVRVLECGNDEISLLAWFQMKLVVLRVPSEPLG
jgi:hypothetical protein